MRKWFSLCGDFYKHNVKVWLLLVKDMKWYNAKTQFTVAFSEYWQVDYEETVVNQLEPYKKHIQGTDITVLSMYTTNTLTSNRKDASKNQTNTFFVEKNAKKVERRDSNKGRE